ncbi:ABC transporter permease subunit [Cohnella endophytica]|uniref:ABC transporter permease subunit n=1 Tax=Cohnella endophytica TaxID=2419778 RepID=A0A494X4B9_9BACL|nr:ABC transporter permease subunit [Cohnella endophytica]RKP44501.1 ABC transporter permease subunit [Cohnella endophytica]
MRVIVKWGLLSLFTLLAVFLMSNISKAFIHDKPDEIRLIMGTQSTVEEAVSNLPGSTVVDAEASIVSVPYGRTDEYGKLAVQLPGVYRVAGVPLAKPEISFRYYFFSLKDRLQGYLHGDLGLIRTSSGRYDIPVKNLIADTILRTCAYFIPGLIAGALMAVALSLLASLRQWIRKLLDGIHALISGLPDFLLIILLQFTSIYLTRLTGKSVILVAQFGDEVPFLIPFLTIALIPCMLIYGTLRLAIERELTQDYVTTALAKGLSRREVLLRHVLRNIMEDLLTILPKATTLALASMAVAEAICDILGLGGYIVSPRMQNISGTPTICIALAVISMLFHVLYALLAKRFVVRSREVA